MHAHLVFVTKYRRDIFSEEVLASLRGHFERVCNDFEAELIEVSGKRDHVHLLVNYPPKVALSRLINSLKGVSSRQLKKDHPWLEKHYWKGALWSPSYFAASCGGEPLEIIRKYIENQ